MFPGHSRQDTRDDNDGQAVQQGQRRDQQGGLPSRVVFVEFFVVGIVDGVVSEKHEE
jgi:hypothetical protein